MSLPAFHPAETLVLLAAFCGFLLRTAAAYLACRLIANLLGTPSLRFVVWLCFLLGSAAYWLGGIAALLAKPWQHAMTQSPQLTAGAGLTAVPLSGGAASLIAQAALWGALAYSAALAVLLGAGVARQLRLASVLRYRLAPPPAWVSLFVETAAEMRAPRGAELWLLPGLASPASLGWRRPAVYLPEEALEPPAALRDVLRHELSHLRRRDAAWESAARFCRWLLFFHPLVHRAFAALRLERELACDCLVVRQDPGTRDLYAETLVRFGWRTSLAADASTSSDPVGIGFTSRAAILNARVQSILAGEQKHSHWSWLCRIAGSSAACWLLAAVAPALWIGFALPGSAMPVPASASARPLVMPFGRSHRQGYVSAARRSSVPGASSLASAALIPPGPAALARTAPRAGFHVQNEDEPMFDPASDTEAATRLPSPEAGRPGTAARPALPSVTSIATAAVMQLGRLGGDRDRDHD